MGIQEHQDKDVVSIYDPKRDAYYEESLERIKTQLRSLGFDETEIETKITKLKEKKQ